jgi:2-oxoglutarate ferredoxin oxidoreductase subunit beta
MAITESTREVKLTTDEFKGPVEPDWCPGCGDFGVLRSLQQAYSELGLGSEDVVTVSGIGCSSNLPGFINTYGMHTLHGRSLPHAMGLHLANHELKVVCTVGDGDGFGIGGNHFIHTMRKNVDITMVVMDNQIYGLTTGQTSPTSRHGMKTKSTPWGSLETPLNPMALAIAGGATFVARGFAGRPKQLVELIKQGMNHRGFSFIDVFSPCVTFNKDNTYAFFKQRVYDLQEDRNHDPSDWKAALEYAYEWGDEIPVGVFVQNEDLYTLVDQEPVLQEGGPLAHRELGIAPDAGRKLVEELM